MGSKKLSVEDYSDILRQVCEALKTSFAHGLEEAIRYVGRQANDPQTVQQANAIVNDLKAFRKFLKLETEVLKRCGVNPKTAAELARLTEQYRDSYDLGALNTDEMLAGIRALQSEACTGMTDAAAYVADQQQLFKDAQFDLRVTASSIAAGNLSALAITMGMSGILTTVSAGFGGLMMTWAGFMKDRTQSPPKKKGWWQG
jgi:hypothetical protein